MNVAGLARSTFFYHQPWLRALEPKEEPKAAISEIFETNLGRYMRWRVHAELLKQAWTAIRGVTLTSFGCRSPTQPAFLSGRTQS